jgi:hypothetical protein
MNGSLPVGPSKVVSVDTSTLKVLENDSQLLSGEGQKHNPLHLGLLPNFMALSTFNFISIASNNCEWSDGIGHYV